MIADVVLSGHLLARELPTGSISVERKDDSPEAVAAIRELVLDLLNQAQMTRMAELVAGGGYDVELSLSRDDEAELDTSQLYFLDLIARIDDVTMGGQHPR